ncbi:MAG: hypothetical protein ACR2H6_09635 [Pyrinomonadaceae bacterium]
MPKLNWNRIIIGGLVAAIIGFLTDGFFHESVVGADWNSVYATLGAREPTESAGSMVYFAIFELGRGFIAMFLYVLMRQPFKPGPKTGALAGIVSWLAFSVTGPAQFIPLGFYSHALWGKVGAFQLVTSIVAAIAGAAIYKDK